MKTRRHWSVDERRMRQRHPERYRLWRIEQRVNLGLGRQRLARATLRKYWRQLQLDADRKAYLVRLLWPRRRS